MSSIQRQPRPMSIALAVPVLLLAAGVRILGLGNTDLWGDEAFSVMTALGPVQHLLEMLATGEPHPPLYPFLLVVWLRALGHSELVARLPSAFAGIASVAVAMTIARSFVSDKDARAVAGAGFVAGLLVALNPIQVWYSQEARMYAQVSFFAGLSTLALLLIWKKRRGATALYILAILGAAGSHYYGLYVPLAHGLAVLTFGRLRRDVLVQWLRAVVVAAILYVPWVVVASRVFTGYYGAQPGTVDLFGIALSGWVRIAAGWSLSWEHAVAVAAVVTILVIVGLLLKPTSLDDQFIRVVLACWLLTPFVTGFVVSLVRPMYAERYFVVSSLPFALLTTRAVVGLVFGRGSAGPRPMTPLLAGVTSPGERGSSGPRAGTPSFLDSDDRGGPASQFADLNRTSVLPTHSLPGTTRSIRARPSAVESLFAPRRRVSAVAGLIALVVAVGLALPPLHNVWIGRYLKSAYNTHMRMVDALARPNDAVILDGTSQLPLYQYYLTRPFPTYPLPDKLPLDLTETATTLEHIAQTHEGAWIFLYATPDYDPSYFIPRWLTTHAYRAFDIWEVNGRLQYYRFATPDAMTSHPSQIEFGNALRLQRYAMRDAAYAAGESVPIDLEWTPLPTRIANPTISLRLVDDTGFTWAQTDQAIGGGYLPNGTLPAVQSLDDRHGLLIPPGTPPGSYRLLLNVYSSDHPERFAATGAGADVTPAGVVLATIHLTRASQSIWSDGMAGFHPTTATMGDSLALLGFAGSDSAAAGESGYLTLVWKALADHPTVSRVRVELVNGDGKVVEQRDLPIATSAFPPSQWRAGDVLREQYRLPLAARLPPGTYRLRAEPAMQPTQAVALGSLQVQPGPALPPPAAPEHPLADTLGGAVALAGYDLESSSVRPGESIRLTLHWHDVAPLDDDYTVFVHVLDGAEKVVAQRDQFPADGQRPTSSWFPGDDILDAYALALPANLSPGEYAIEVGMYNANDGKRLPVTLDGKPAGDRIIIARLQVRS